MVQRAAERNAGERLIAQQGAPIGNDDIVGQQDRTLLVTSGHELKEGMGPVDGEPRVAHLVNDQHPRLDNAAAAARRWETGCLRGLRRAQRASRAARCGQRPGPWSPELRREGFCPRLVAP